MDIAREEKSPVEYWRRNEGRSLSRRSQTAAWVTAFDRVLRQVVCQYVRQVKQRFAEGGGEQPHPHLQKERPIGIRNGGIDREPRWRWA